MDDKNIIGLYWSRSESAIEETDRKYGRYCYRIAFNILANQQDSEERVSDTYLTAWNHIPPERPQILSAYLGKITRNLSLKYWRDQHTQKRGGGQTVLALEELEQCISAGSSTEQEVDRRLLADAINRFLDSLKDEQREIFLQRYWYLQPIEQIAREHSYSDSKITSMLFRIRGKLRQALEKEEFI